MVGTYSLVFSVLLRLNVPNYWLFLFVGLVAWQFFMGSGPDWSDQPGRPRQPGEEGQLPTRAGAPVGHGGPTESPRWPCWPSPCRSASCCGHPDPTPAAAPAGATGATGGDGGRSWPDGLGAGGLLPRRGAHHQRDRAALVLPLADLLRLRSPRADRQSTRLGDQPAALRQPGEPLHPGDQRR